MSYFLNIYPVIGSERTDQLQATEEKKKNSLNTNIPVRALTTFIVFHMCPINILSGQRLDT